jgi:putative peptidoglycan lipid II flippase
MHLGVQLPGLARVGLRWAPEFGWRDANLRQIVILFLPRAADLALISLSTIILTNLLTRLGTGATSAFDWGWRLMQIPQTLIGTAMGIVIFPTLAALSTLGDVDGKRSAMAGALRFILVATIPSAVLLLTAGRPLLSLLEGGAFDAQASGLVFIALQFFTIGIIVHSMLEVIARSFYADKDTLTPLLVAAGGAAINIGVALVFSGVLSGDVRPENVGWLALSNTLGVAFEVAALGYMLHRRWSGIEGASLLRAVLKTLVASALMGAAVLGVEAAFRAAGLAERGALWTIIMLAVSAAAAVVVFVSAAWLLRMEEVRALIVQSVALARARFRRQPSGAAA